MGPDGKVSRADEALIEALADVIRPYLEPGAPEVPNELATLMGMAIASRCARTTPATPDASTGPTSSPPSAPAETPP